MTEVVDFNKHKDSKKSIEMNCVIDIDKKYAGPTQSLDDAIKGLELGTFAKKVITTFSDQVTCVCTKTGKGLFDLERAKEIRKSLSDVFTAILYSIDDEIEENS